MQLEDFQLDRGQETWLQLASLGLISGELNLPAKQISIRSLLEATPISIIS